jgi:hypothetical protein
MMMKIMPALPSANDMTFQASTSMEGLNEVSKKGKKYRRRGRKAYGTSDVARLSFNPFNKTVRNLIPCQWPMQKAKENNSTN